MRRAPLIIAVVVAIAALIGWWRLTPSTTTQPPASDRPTQTAGASADLDRDSGPGPESASQDAARSSGDPVLPALVIDGRTVFRPGVPGFATSEQICRDPQVVDPACGDGGRGVMRTDELEALAEQGDAIALFYLGMRTHREPHVALAYYDRALVRGVVGSLHAMAHTLTELGATQDGAARSITARDAYVHLVAGMMLGYSHFRSTLVDSEMSRFPDVPVDASVCDAAARLVSRVNADRAALGFRPLNVFLDRDAIGAMLAAENGYCRIP